MPPKRIDKETATELGLIGSILKNRETINKRELALREGDEAAERYYSKSSQPVTKALSDLFTEKDMFGDTVNLASKLNKLDDISNKIDTINTTLATAPAASAVPAVASTSSSAAKSAPPSTSPEAATFKKYEVAARDNNRAITTSKAKGPSPVATSVSYDSSTGAYELGFAGSEATVRYYKDAGQYEIVKPDGTITMRFTADDHVIDLLTATNGTIDTFNISSMSAPATAAYFGTLYHISANGVNAPLFGNKTKSNEKIHEKINGLAALHYAGMGKTSAAISKLGLDSTIAYATGTGSRSSASTSLLATAPSVPSNTAVDLLAGVPAPPPPPPPPPGLLTADPKPKITKGASKPPPPKAAAAPTLDLSGIAAGASRLRKTAPVSKDVKETRTMQGFTASELNSARTGLKKKEDLPPKVSAKPASSPQKVLADEMAAMMSRRRSAIQDPEEDDDDFDDPGPSKGKQRGSGLHDYRKFGKYWLDHAFPEKQLMILDNQGTVVHKQPVTKGMMQLIKGSGMSGSRSAVTQSDINKYHKLCTECGHKVTGARRNNILKLVTSDDYSHVTLMDPADAKERLMVMRGEVQAGNNSPSVKNELMALADFLLKRKSIKVGEHRAILRLCLGS